MKKTLVERFLDLPIVRRWRAEINAFWKQVLGLCLTLAISATGVLSVNEYFQLELPDNIVSICKYVIAVAGGMGLAAKLTKK